MRAGMRSLVRSFRAILALVGSVMALVGCPGVASADLTVTGARIDGVTSTSSPPGGVMDASVTVDITQGSEWEGTEVGPLLSRNRRCVDTDDEDGGTETDSFNVTSPGRPG